MGWERISGFSLDHFLDWGILTGAVRIYLYRQRVQKKENAAVVDEQLCLVICPSSHLSCSSIEKNEYN
jgi:hypothetical protein